MFPRSRCQQVAVVCGYDLIAHAVQDRLADSAFEVTAISPHAWLTGDAPTADILILDGAALEVAPLDDYRNRLRDARLLLIHTDNNPFRIQQLNQQGIDGYLYLGDQLCERLSQAVTDIAEGGTYFSPTAVTSLAEADHLAEIVLPRISSYQLEVLQLMGRHWPAARIAHRLDRTTEAIYKVQGYLRGLFDVETNGALIKRVRELGLI